MSEALDGRAKRIIDQVIDLDAVERAKFLEGVGDLELRHRALALLSLMEKDDAFLREPTINFSSSIHLPASLDQIGHRIGPYTIVELIGEGGFGTVYLAEQSVPVRRQVALKIIKPGMDTRQVIARFEAERQALAMMDHPGIARVLDAGATDQGRPYFVMELVRGEHMTSYCDRQRLTIRERLELFRETCGAIQHAHQKGVIHRDLKPGNILVTTVDGRAAVKVIDFGIAKATAGRLTDASLHTELHQLIGTPEYMSPEQADLNSPDIDTRSDIYTLGVLLFELLTGNAPFDRERLRSSPFAEVQRILREEEPPRPSMRLACSGNIRAHAPSSSAGLTPDEIARSRRTDLFPLARSLRGDLDWIVLKCLEKDRARRYQTAGALADDVSRHLSDEPVSAGPPGAAYRMRKFAKRHRAAALAGAVSVVALLIATGVSISFGLSEARQRKEAEFARDQLDQVARFQEAQFARVNPETMGMQLRADLVAGIRHAAESSRLRGDDVDARVQQFEELIAGSDFTGMAVDSIDSNVFQPALAAIDSELKDQPLVKARLLQSLAGALRDLGLFDRAAAPQQEALRIREEALGDDHPETLRSLSDRGLLLFQQGNYRDAEPILRDALTRQRRVLGDDHAETILTMTRLGKLLTFTGDLSGAATQFEEALSRDRDRPVGPHDSPISAMLGLASVLQQQGKYAEAENRYREALSAIGTAKGAEQLEDEALHGIGLALKSQGKLPESEEYFRRTLELNRRLRGDDHPFTLNAVVALADFLADVGRRDEAESSLRDVLPKYRRLLGNRHSLTLSAITNLAYVLQLRGKLEEAEAFAREAYETRRTILGPDHSSTLTSANNLSQILQARGHLPEAEALAREILEVRRRTLGEEHPDTIGSINNIGGLLWAQKRYEEAEPLYRDALEKFRHALGDDHPRTINAANNVGMILQAQGKLTDAEPYIRETLEKRRRIQGEDHPDTIGAVNNMGALLKSQGRLSDAEVYYREALEKYRRVLGNDHPNTIIAIINLGILFQSQGQMDAAEQHLSEALALRRKVLGEHHPETLALVVWLGEFLHDRQKDAEAVALLLPEESALRRISTDGNTRLLVKYLFALGRARSASGDDESAESNLLEAWAMGDKAQSTSDANREEMIQEFIKFYDARDRVDPKQGYDAKAGEWRDKLDAFRALTGAGDSPPSNR